MTYYRRNLPHWHPEGVHLFITWKLHGALPQARLQPDVSPGQAFRAWDALLDAARSGPDWLKDPRLAAMVVNALRDGDRVRGLYRLRAHVVMVNHVHVLLQPLTLGARITQWIKGTTAREANRLMGRTGTMFWQHESYDHWARDNDEVERIVRYIERNPVAAGLVTRVEQWPWSSAYEAAQAQAEACATQAEACATQAEACATGAS